MCQRSGMRSLIVSHYDLYGCCSRRSPLPLASRICFPVSLILELRRLLGGHMQGSSPEAPSGMQDSRLAMSKRTKTTQYGGFCSRSVSNHVASPP